MRRTRSLSLLLAAVPLGALLAISAAARADTVGTAGAVNTTSSGTPPGAPTRVIEIGTQVVENEKIQTTATGSVQVLFIDKTTLNVGPNSSLVIDRFVYNPATTNGELALSLGKGVLRVVGGVATHSEGATIRTPVAAIGLRGGIAIISHNAAKGTQAILGFGHMSVTTLCAAAGANCNPTTVQVTRPGFGVTVAGFNTPPSSPGRASSQELAQASGQLTSHGGQTGGASQQPTDNLAQSYNVGTPNSPGAPIIQTASQGRANALTVTNAVRQTVTTGAQLAPATATAIRVAVQNIVASQTPPHGGGGGGNSGGGGGIAAVAAAIAAEGAAAIAVVAAAIAAGVEAAAVAAEAAVEAEEAAVEVAATPAPTATYAMVTHGPFSTSSAGASPAPYLTGAFAGTGGFTVSPILGYQTRRPQSGRHAGHDLEAVSGWP